ncbi:MAG: SDR family oxidoreductase [Burkholderiales bacterium]|jgi:NAD(P)-dependent dehydrogenase (short-subunit alcohol dehydrogenase family)
MSIEISLAGRVALVTGGSRGIGRAIALQLARAGADIAINYRRDDAAARETVAEIQALGRQARAYAASVESRDEAHALAQQVLHDFGAVHVLVNNAGISSRGQRVTDTDPGEPERVMAVHVWGPFHLCQALVPQMRGLGRGDIVMISSVATRRFAANGAPYSMAKAAMEALAVTLAKEERSHGIRTHIVSPTLTDTEMGRRLARARGSADIRTLDASSPFGRVSVPEDVAAVVAFLVSSANPYVNGQNIAVDGGGL